MFCANSNKSDLCEKSKTCDVNVSLEELKTLQLSDGSYNLDDKLGKALEIALEKLNEDANKLGVPEKVFATAIAIAFFMNKFAAEKEVWDLTVVKAKMWLSKNVSDAAVIDIVIAMASLSF